MSANTVERQLEKEFHVSWFIIVYKFIFGLIETLSGFGLAFFGKQILKLYTVDVSKELFEDPHDLIATVSEKFVPNLFTHNNFIVIYLIILGLAKVAGAVGLIYKQNWGVDLLVSLTVVMLPFQIVNLLLHPSLFDSIYILIGILIALYLIEFKPRAWISRVLKVR